MDQHLDGDARKAFFAGKPHSSQAEQHPQSQTPDLEGIPAHTMGPGDVPAEKRRHHHRHKHSKPNNQDSDDEDRPIIPPAELVQMILGEDENDNTRGVRPIFSEMEVLHRFDDFFEWREQARWIKFEEDVEEGGVRWSKPHVASLSLHSLFELRSMLLNGAVLLDLDASTLDHVVDLVLDHLPTLTPAVKEKVRVILLQRHRHLYERGKEGVMCQLPRPERHSTRRLSSPRRTPADGLEYRRNSVYNSKHQIIKHKGNMDFMRKIPAGAEASNILVGEVDFLDKPVSAFVRLRTATLFGDLTEVPVPTRFIFILLAPTGGAINVTEVGRTMGTLMADEVFAAVAYRARAPQHLLAAADEFMGSATVLPPGEWDPDIRIEPPDAVPSQEPRKRPESMLEYVDPEIQEQKMREESGLTRSGRLFGGMINDLKRKAPWFWSDFKDALAMQCVASWIFLYFACLSPIITFGGLLSEATGRNMAAMESLVSGFACGVIYGFFSGQPLAILGSTGPVLVFEAIIYDVSISMGLDYMTFRLWIGLWMAFILFVMVATDAGSFVCYITRFTEENFATLIALIFVYKAIENVMKLSKKFPLDTHQSSLGHCVCKLPPLLPPIDGFNWTTLDPHSCQSLNGSLVGDGCDAATKHVPDVFLMSVILFFGTFTISIILKDFKNSLFFKTKVRQFLSDFAVIIAIVIMSFIDYTVNIPTPKLEVPSEFKPTLAERGWLIPFSNNPLWTIPLAFLPAIIGTILIFMDQQITVVIVNRKDNKLKKGCGYHLDLFVLSILIALCSVMGLPWFVASTVQSINHVDSLKIESECAAPGDKPQFLGVREQRVTHILIFLMIGLSVLITPILSHIPMPVLFGVFLYMGVASLKGLQFFDRILLMFMPTKYQPDFAFLRKVPIRRVHLFTMIQLLCFILLWLINSYSQTSILFPIMLVVLVGVRKCLDFIFTQRELKALDDIMPSSKKRKHHGKDAESGFKEDNLKIPLTNGNLKIVIKPMNVSEEVTKTGIWKQVNNDKNNSLNTRKKTILKDSSTTEDNDRNGAVPAHQSQPPLKRGKT